MMPLKTKKKSYSGFRYSKKQLRAPIAFLFLAIYACIVYANATPSQPILPTNDLPIHLYSNQVTGNLQKTFKEAILNAKESIVCIIYALTDDEIITALRKKAEEGLSVLVVHDPVTTQNIAFRLGPKVQVKSLKHKGLMHNKLISIDHK